MGSSQSFIDACSAGYLETAQDLLTNKIVNVTQNQNLALRLACQNGHSEVVSWLLTVPKVDVAAVDNDPLLLACVSNHLGVVEILLAQEKVNPMARNNAAFFVAYDTGNIDLLRLLLAHPQRDSIIKEVFPRVCYDGKKGIGVAFVKEFLACPILPLQNKTMLSILLSVYHQHEEIVSFFLTHRLTNVRHQPEVWPLALSLGIKDTPMLELLLAHKIDPNTRKGEAFCIACSRGYLPQVKLFIDYGVSPFDPEKPFNKNPLAIASEIGNLEIIQLLTTEVGKKNTIGLTTNHIEEAIELASRKGQITCIEYLLKNPLLQMSKEKLEILTKSRNPLMSSLTYWLGAESHFQKQGWEMNSALTIAAIYNDLDRVKQILKSIENAFKLGVPQNIVYFYDIALVIPQSHFMIKKLFARLLSRSNYNLQIFLLSQTIRDQIPMEILYEILQSYFTSTKDKLSLNIESNLSDLKFSHLIGLIRYCENPFLPVAT